MPASADAYLSAFTRRTPNTAVAAQPLLPEPRTVRQGYEVSAEEEGEEAAGEGGGGKAMVMVNWLLADAPLPPEEGLLFEVLSA
eukprot:COSAG01_NODE_11054_length_2019_cov_1.720312_3_plen_84_part_00